MVLQECYTLKDGPAIPKLALGTWQLQGEEATAAVCAALAVGYRHIDTAAAYENEREMAAGIRQSGLPAEEVFITTKIPAEVKSYAGAKESIARSREYLQKDCLDLLLIHAPRPWSEFGQPGAKSYDEENRAVWRAMTEAKAAGQVRAIGVSNFSAAEIENLSADGPCPQADQISIHIGRADRALIDWCQARGILVMAYAPNATGQLPKNAAVAAMAQKYGVSVPQLGSRWALQLGTLPLPRSKNPAHIRENAALDFVIDAADMAVLTALQE